MNLRRFGSGLLTIGQVLSIGSLAIAGGLMVWAALPMVFGLSTHAVVTGSMTPQVAVGDVLVSDRVDAGALKPGMVVLFKDPSDPERTVSHRIKSINADGSLVTKGDANNSVDAMPIPIQNVEGVAKLRIPWIGYPAVWFGAGRYDLVLVTLLMMAGATALAAWPDADDDDDPSAGVTVDEPWPWLVPMRTP